MSGQKSEYVMKRAYREGRKAYREGLGVDENPYPSFEKDDVARTITLNQQRRSWFDGWYDEWRIRKYRS